MTAQLTPRNALVVALLAILALVPVYCSFTGNYFLMTLFTRILILAMAAVSLNLIMGFGGMVSFGHAAYLGIGAALAGLAGLMQAAILTAQIGMGENILILAFVVIIIGGIGSIRGAFVASILVGLIDTVGRAFLPDLLKAALSPAAASTVAPALSSMLIYLIMAVVLVVRPEGLFPAASK